MKRGSEMEIIDLHSREVFGHEGRGVALLIEEPNLHIEQIGLEPGKAVPVQKTGVPVTIQVVRGEGIFFVEGQTVRIGVGKLLRIPMGSSMGVANDTQGPLVLLAIRTPQPHASHKSALDSRVGTFVNIIDFAPLKPGKEEAFRKWFRHSSEVFARHRGYLSRSLLGPIEGGSRYAAIVEHETKETFMDMHLSDDREEMFRQAESLVIGASKPHFYELLDSQRNP
jgi:quercetin dioxygenase-like cupin family protein/heme-degrading monooxygenase HmoA